MNASSRFLLASAASAVLLAACGQQGEVPADGTPLGANQTVQLQGTAGGEVEFTGVVQSISAPRLVVSGITVVTTPATEIKRGDTKIPLTALRIGETVKVEGTLEADGSVTAREIKAAGLAPQPTPTPGATPTPGPAPTPGPTPSPSPTPDDDDDDDEELEFTGIIQSITPPSLRVSERSVLTDGRTEFKGEGRIHSLLDLRVGDTVEVEGTLMADGSTVLASEIKRR